MRSFMSRISLTKKLSSNGSLSTKQRKVMLRLPLGRPPSISKKAASSASITLKPATNAPNLCLRLRLRPPLNLKQNPQADSRAKSRAESAVVGEVAGVADATRQKSLKQKTKVPRSTHQAKIFKRPLFLRRHRSNGSATKKNAPQMARC